MLSRKAMMGREGGTQDIPLTLPSENSLFRFYAGDGKTVPVEIATGGDGQAVTAVADQTGNGLDPSKNGAVAIAC